MRAVIVTRDEPVRAVARGVLARSEGRPALFSDPETAFCFLCRCGPRPRALVVDERIGRAAAGCLLRRARLLEPGLATALLQAGDGVSGDACGAEQVLARPGAGRALEQWLLRALSGARGVRPERTARGGQGDPARG